MPNVPPKLKFHFKGPFEYPEGNNVHPSELNSRQILYEYWARYCNDFENNENEDVNDVGNNESYDDKDE